MGSIDSLDPVAVSNSSELMLLSNVVEPLLVREVATGRLVPSAAEKYDISKDGKKLTFTLRGDLRWSNGEPIVAEDFAYGLRRLLSLRADRWPADFFAMIQGAGEWREGAVMDPGQVGVRSTGARSLKIDLTRPSSSILELLALPYTAPIYKAAIDRHREFWWKPENWVGSGPFVPAQIGPTTIVLKKNVYHRLAPEIVLSEVQISMVARGSEAARLYREGKIDQFGDRDHSVPEADAVPWFGKPDLLVQPDARTTFLRSNVSKSALSQAAFREALASAIDRNVLREIVAGERAEPAFSLVPDGLKIYDPPTGYLQNVSGARILLESLGYCLSRASTDCKRLPLLTILHRDRLRDRKLALALAALWKSALGLQDVRSQALKSAEVDRKVRAAEYQIVLDDLAVLPERPFDFLNAFRSDRPTAGGFSSQTYDQLLDGAETESRWDPARLQYRRAEAMLLREGGVIPLLHGSTLLFLSPAVRGFEPNIWDLHPFARISISR